MASVEPSELTACPGRETPAATNAAIESVVPAAIMQLDGRPDLHRGEEDERRERL